MPVYFVLIDGGPEELVLCRIDEPNCYNDMRCAIPPHIAGDNTCQCIVDRDINAEQRVNVSFLHSRRWHRISFICGSGDSEERYCR